MSAFRSTPLIRTIRSIREKGLEGTGNLRGEADAILPETAIASFLGGLSLDDYRSLLCLDDDTIEKGGEDIASAQGDIGRLLFSAAAGVADLNAVLEQARAEANGLYKKRASTTRVAELKRELSDVETNIRDLDISAHAWRKLKDALDAAENEEAKAREVRDELRTKQAGIAALRRVLPNLGEMDRLTDEIAGYADYPQRIDINTEDLVTMKTDRGQADAELRRLQDDIEKIEQARAALVIAREIGISSRQLERLFGRLLNCSPKKYYVDLRLQKAQKLLVQTDLSVTSIALTTGFNSPTHFAKIFKAHFGTAPSDQKNKIE